MADTDHSTFIECRIHPPGLKTPRGDSGGFANVPADVLETFGQLNRMVANGEVGETPNGNGTVRAKGGRRGRYIARLYAEAIDDYFASGDDVELESAETYISFACEQLKRGSVPLDLLPKRL
jgi:hypothetical protein